MQTLLEQIEAAQLWDFPGGIHPPTRKSQTSHKAIAKLPLADRLYIPLRQHIGVAGQCLVKKGDYVQKGQALSLADSSMSVPVHAPTSGLILAVENHTSPHPSALPELTVILEPDGLDEWREREPLDYLKCTDHQLLERIQESGIAGMGGAGFPTHIKSAIQQGVDCLIINGVECEPYISADDVLMQEDATTIVKGIDILCRLLDPKIVLIGIEDDKPTALAAMQAACKQREHYFIRSIPTKYPSGGEKQLIQILTNQEVPAGRRPIDIGMVMFNIGTSFAIAQAVLDDIPLISRIVTVAGDTLTQAQNMLVPIGTPVSALLSACGFQPQSQQRVIMGGPMMGFTLPDLSVPIIKTTNCILAPTYQELPPAGQEMDCIRCTACADACPASLLPQQLLWYSKAKDSAKLEEYNLFDCIECGACAYVCPSEIPLVQYYRVAKATIRQEQREALQAEQAKARFEARKSRLEAEKQERQRRHEHMAAERAAKQRTGSSDAVAAALARAKAKQQGDSASKERIKAEQTQRKEQVRTQQTSTAEINEPSKTQSSARDPRKAAIAAAVARAKAKQANQDDAIATKTTEPAVEPTNSKQAAIAAAIARAKAKKAAQQSNHNDNQPVETSEQKTDARKAAIAAAVARAKAKQQKDNDPK